MAADPNLLFTRRLPNPCEWAAGLVAARPIAGAGLEGVEPRWAASGTVLERKSATPHHGLRNKLADLICRRHGVWPGVRRAGRPTAEPGADAGPAAP